MFVRVAGWASMKLQDYFDISQAADAVALQRRLVGFAERLGFGLITAAVVVEAAEAARPPAFHVISNMPDGFKETSADPQLSVRDPVNRRLKKLSVPFSYDQALYVAEGAADLWDRQALFGYRTGVAVGLHLPGRKHFLLGIDRDEALPKADSKIVRLFADVQLLAVHAQSAAMRLLTPSAEAEPLARLTPRELEVLCWTREGKSAWEVGRIVGISEATVNFHLRNLCAKLGVASKHQAVLRALRLGLMA